MPTHWCYALPIPCKIYRAPKAKPGYLLQCVFAESGLSPGALKTCQACSDRCQALLAFRPSCHPPPPANVLSVRSIGHTPKLYLLKKSDQMKRAVSAAARGGGREGKRWQEAHRVHHLFQSRVRLRRTVLLGELDVIDFPVPILIKLSNHILHRAPTEAWCLPTQGTLCEHSKRARARAQAPCVLWV
jgi:hypothetical protein